MKGRGQPWQNFRKGIKSERIRTTPSHFKIFFQIIPNQSKKRFESRSIQVA